MKNGHFNPCHYLSSINSGQYIYSKYKWSVKAHSLSLSQSQSLGSLGSNNFGLFSFPLQFNTWDTDQLVLGDLHFWSQAYMESHRPTWSHSSLGKELLCRCQIQTCQTECTTAESATASADPWYFPAWVCVCVSGE